MSAIMEPVSAAKSSDTIVEVKNIGSEPLDLTGVRFTKGVRFDFTGSDVTVLFPGEYAIIAKPNLNGDYLSDA